jgi:hypothetical protein
LPQEKTGLVPSTPEIHQAQDVADAASVSVLRPGLSILRRVAAVVSGGGGFQERARRFRIAASDRASTARLMPSTLISQSTVDHPLRFIAEALRIETYICVEFGVDPGERIQFAPDHPTAPGAGSPSLEELDAKHSCLHSPNRCGGQGRLARQARAARADEVRSAARCGGRLCRRALREARRKERLAPPSAERDHPMRRREGRYQRAYDDRCDRDRALSAFATANDARASSALRPNATGGQRRCGRGARSGESPDRGPRPAPRWLGATRRRDRAASSRYKEACFTSHVLRLSWRGARIPNRPSVDGFAFLFDHAWIMIIARRYDKR